MVISKGFRNANEYQIQNVQAKGLETLVYLKKLFWNKGTEECDLVCYLAFIRFISIVPIYFPPQ